MASSNRMMDGRAPQMRGARGGMMSNTPQRGPGQYREPEQDDGESDGDVTPEEQAAYHLFMSNASKVMFDKAAMPKLVEQLRGGEPVAAVAQAAVLIVARLEDSAEKKTGAQVDPDILLNAGREIVGALAEIAEKAKIHEFTEQEIEAAYLAAVDQYRSLRMGQGKINPADYQGAWQELQQANADGSIDTKYPALKQYADRMKQEGIEPEAPVQATQGRGVAR